MLLQVLRYFEIRQSSP